MSNIKTILSTLALTLLATNTYALNYTVGLNSKNEDKDFTYSNCQFKDWGSEKILPNKPGPNDMLQIFYGRNLLIDADINVKVLNVLASGSADVRDRQNVKMGSVDFNIGGAGQTTSLSLKNSKAFVNGGIKMSCYPNSRSLGRGCIYLENSVLSFKRNLATGFALDSNTGFFNNNGKRGGVDIELVGKSFLEFEGGIVHDMQLRENAKDFIFKVTLTEKDGNIPLFRVEKAASVQPMEVSINIKTPIRKGTFTLMEFDYRKDNASNLRSITLNGKPAAVGDSVEIGGRTVTLKVAASKSSTARDKGTANDLVVEIK